MQKFISALARVSSTSGASPRVPITASCCRTSFLPASFQNAPTRFLPVSTPCRLYAVRPNVGDFVMPEHPLPAESFPSMIPPPRGGMTVELFLKRIGKDCGQYADKYNSWEELFTFKRRQLKNLEIPVQQRRWILRWVHKYKLGVEPYAIPFKSKANKHKARREANRKAFLEAKAKVMKVRDEIRAERRIARLREKNELKRLEEEQHAEQELMKEVAAIRAQQERDAAAASSAQKTV
eukprot:TRINITY_DN11706_c0_g1_i1.p1 TRINITY_DN11706_c0_g1~~TRINITY_DN11706_c0_g1_i1.p1  ORF type:complete len:237 (+),score=23.96 TRINITY_DN11706_c0_g1_i1:93-803(+)